MNTPSRSYRLWLVGCVLLVGSVAGAGWALRPQGSPSPGETIETARPTTVSGEGVICTGYVDIEGGVTPLYPTQPGRVVEVLAHDEEEVAAGTVLFRVDDRQARLLVQQAETDVRAGELQLADARRLPRQHASKRHQQEQAIAAFEHRLQAARFAQERKQDLAAREQLNGKEASAAAELVRELEAAVAAEKEKLHELDLADPANAVARAEADLAARRVRLEQARLALSECQVVAPAAGKVLRMLVSPGEVLGTQPRQPAVEFCRAGPRMVRVEVEQEFANRVVVGMAALAHDDSRSAVQWRGKVARISDWYTHRRSMVLEPLQINDVRTLECIIDLDPGQPLPKIGQRLRVRLSPTPVS